MKKIASLLLLSTALTCSGNALAEWQEIGKTDAFALYVDTATVQKQVDKLVQTKAQTELATKSVPALKETVAFDDFAKMDIRIGEIVAAEKMEKSKKLLKLQVNDGFVTRTILSGIAEHFAPEDLLGKQVTFLANLAPRKMMGIESEGMILMAEDADGV